MTPISKTECSEMPILPDLQKRIGRKSVPMARVAKLLMALTRFHPCHITRTCAQRRCRAKLQTQVLAAAKALRPCKHCKSKTHQWQSAWSVNFRNDNTRPRTASIFTGNWIRVELVILSGSLNVDVKCKAAKGNFAESQYPYRFWIKQVVGGRMGDGIKTPWRFISRAVLDDGTNRQKPHDRVCSRITCFKPTARDPSYAVACKGISGGCKTSAHVDVRRSIYRRYSLLRREGGIETISIVQLARKIEDL